jgi:hypothetical protein
VAAALEFLPLLLVEMNWLHRHPSGPVSITPGEVIGVTFPLEL